MMNGPKRWVYMDHSATSPMLPEVLEAMSPFFTERFGNASSIHSYGRASKASVEHARKHVSALIGAQPDEMVFTSGGTESDNLALKGVAMHQNRLQGHLITTKIEHHAILESCQFLSERGFEVTQLPVSVEGIVDPGEVERAIKEDTVLISVMTANNEIGTVQPIAEIGRIAHEHGVLLHTDAVQAVGRLSIDVRRDNIDLLSLSGHKFNGPKGVGALFVRKGLEVDPMLHGGGHERGMRSSTENVPGIVGLGKAAEIAKRDFVKVNETMKTLRDRMIEEIPEAVPRSYLNGHRTKRLVNNAHFRFDFIEGEALVLQLDLRGIAASTGSACSTGSVEPSHVLLALGISPEQAHGSLRLTLGRENTNEDVDYLLEVLPEVVSRLRRISPYGHESSSEAGGGDSVQ